MTARTMMMTLLRFMDSLISVMSTRMLMPPRMSPSR